tara:strand:- start:934 stop:1095 length:162 start_codon:yes stop_codon:yes gene_type:complete
MAKKTELQKAAGKAYRGMVALNREYWTYGVENEDHEFFEAFNAMMKVIKRLEE